MPNIDKIRVDGTDYDLFAPQVYDDQERVIGTWFGEPLYRKVIKLTKAEIEALPKSDNKYNAVHNISNLEVVTNYMWAARYTQDGVAKTLTLDLSSSPNWCFRIFTFTDTIFDFNLGSEILSLMDYMVVTLEYTKQTTQSEE